MLKSNHILGLKRFHAFRFTGEHEKRSAEKIQATKKSNICQQLFLNTALQLGNHSATTRPERQFVPNFKKRQFVPSGTSSQAALRPKRHFVPSGSSSQAAIRPILKKRPLPNQIFNYGCCESSAKIYIFRFNNHVWPEPDNQIKTDSNYTVGIKCLLLIG